MGSPQMFSKQESEVVQGAGECIGDEVPGVEARHCHHVQGVL